MTSENTTGVVAIIVNEYSEDQITERVNGLDRVDVPVLLARVNPHKKRLAFIEKTAEQRIVGEAILGLGETWVDPQTGEIMVFAGAAGDQECKDPEAFRTALLAAGVPQADVDRAIYPVIKVDFRVAKELAKRSVAAQEAFDDNVVRRPFGPPHLKGVK